MKKETKMEKEEKKKSHKKLWITLGIIGGIILIAFIAIMIYLNIYYSANEYAKAELESTELVEVYKEEDYYVFAPKEYDTGIIFYPGGKVEATAYAPLLKQLAPKGILCVLCEMPFRLAVFNSSAAEGIPEKFDVDHWYLAGHSLGGSMAASYLENHLSDFEGLILLGSYSTVDLSKSNLNVLSIYGEFDGVLNRKKYEESLSNLPSNYKEFVIEGGCHACFGAYGKQDGDGIPTISNEEQIAQTVEFIIHNI